MDCCFNSLNDEDQFNDVDSDDKKPSLLRRYQAILTEYPYSSNATQGAIITASGVMASNYLLTGRVDWKEVIVMMIVSATFITPMLLLFYNILGQLKISNFGKLFLDQACFSPLFTSAIISYKLFLLSNGKLTLSDLLTSLVAIVPAAVQASWCFWIPQRYLTLTFVPPYLHLVLGSLCSFLWQMIFTVVTQGAGVNTHHGLKDL